MTNSFWNMSPQWNHRLFCMWYWAILAFTSLLKYGKHLFILFQKTENSLWACSISSSQKMTCAGYSRPLATSRSAQSFGDPMATAKVRCWLAARSVFSVRLDPVSVHVWFSGVTKSPGSLQEEHLFHLPREDISLLVTVCLCMRGERWPRLTSHAPWWAVSRWVQTDA